MLSERSPYVVIKSTPLTIDLCRVFFSLFCKSDFLSDLFFCIDLCFVWWYNSGIVSVWRFVSLGGLALGVFATWRVAARRTAEEVWYGNKLL